MARSELGKKHTSPDENGMHDLSGPKEDIFFYDVKKILNERLIKEAKEKEEKERKAQERKKWTAGKIFYTFFMIAISLNLIVLIAPFIIPLILFSPILLIIVANLWQAAEQADEAINHTSVKSKLDELLNELKKK